MSTPECDGVILLFLRNAEAVRGFIVGLAAGDLALADDVFQEVFLVVQRRAADFRPDADFTAWARGIARRKLLEVARTRGGGRLPEDVIDLLAGEAPGDEDWEGRRRALRACLSELAPRARELATMRFATALDPGVIAGRMQWTVEAVRVALSRLRLRLRTCAERRLAAEER